ncbi:MAG: hypothetical protein ABIN91_22530 [Mucilaginibacter sp.]|uniref:hypothetical protein n=1 Tax=Mucilaginibacter sp. TaxID=1882438 RepID=UPI003265C300
MVVSKIKSELHQKIDEVNSEQLKQIYGLINNYLVSGENEEWDILTETQKSHILKGLDEAHAGLGNSLTDINKRIKAKYGING